MNFTESEIIPLLVGNFLTTGWEEESATVDIFMEEVKTYTAFKNGIFLDNYWFP